MPRTDNKLDDNRTPEGLLKVSQSKIKQWRDCRRKFWYAHVMGIERRRQPRPLAFGTIIHLMKERLASGKDPFEILSKIPQQDLDAYANDPEHYGDIVQDVRWIFESYLDFWEGRSLDYLEHDGRTAEFPFEVTIGHIVVKGTIDAVTRYRKMLWLTEHKNHKNIPNDDERWRNVQSVVYLRVLKLLGWFKDIEGTCWDYIRSKPPSIPQVNKDGSISQRRIDTLPVVVEATLGRLKKQPGYKSLVDAATLNMPTYFQRVYTPIKPQVLDQVWKDFLATAAEMDRVDLTKPPVRTISRQCTWCQYEAICRASLTGGDEEFVIEHDYRPSSYGEQHEETSDSS